MKTNQYDYAVGISIEAVNKMLAVSMSKMDLSLALDTIDKDTGTKIDIQAQFSPWSIVKNGANKNIHLSLPFESGTCILSEGLESNTDLSTVTLVVEVDLTWMDSSGSGQYQGNGDFTQLVFKPVPGAAKGSQGYVHAISCTTSGTPLKDGTTAVLMNNVPELLAENVDKLNVVFANLVPKPVDFALTFRPSHWDYFYIEDANAAMLCFLCMINDHTPPTAPSFDTSVWSKGNNAFVLMSLGGCLAGPIGQFSMRYPSPTAYPPLTIQENLVSMKTTDVYFGKYPVSNVSLKLNDQGIAFEIDGDFGLNQYETVNTDGGKKYPSDDDITFSYSFSIQLTPKFDQTKQTILFNPTTVTGPTFDSHIPFWDHFSYNIPKINRKFKQLRTEINALFPSSIEKAFPDISGLIAVDMTMYANTTSLMTNLLKFPGGSNNFVLTDGGIDGVVYLKGNI